MLARLLPWLALLASTSSVQAQNCGSGGPGGTFDWVVPAGTTRVVDTTFDVILGGPGGQPTTSQDVVGGVIEVRDLRVEPGALLQFQGPNPVRILATGRVDVEGWISVDGVSSPGTLTLNTTNIPEPGAPGRAGGGRGGTGSYLTTASTPRGGHGFGAFDLPDAGGQGGESCYSALGIDARRAAGGGGGRLGGDVLAPVAGVFVRAQALIGLDAEQGFAGGPMGVGAISQSGRARGGRIGPSPFDPARSGDEFLGTLVTAGGNRIQGELTAVLAGAGGGAGGDAVSSSSFPLVPFSTIGDEKGAGGGGGAGGLMLLVEGELRVGPDGLITADGGTGGGGESTIFLNRIGGGSGGGSGGHLVLQSGTRIRLENHAVAAGDWYDDGYVNGPRKRPVRALGGQGGAGRDDRGGASLASQTLWACDAIPYEAFDPGTVTPPLDGICFRIMTGASTSDLYDWDDPGRVTNPGTGGDGGPGIVQFHVPSLDDLLLPPEVGGDVTKVVAPPPVGWFQGAFRGRLEPDLCASLPLRWSAGPGGPSLLPLAPSGEEAGGTPDLSWLWLSLDPLRPLGR